MEEGSPRRGFDDETCCEAGRWYVGMKLQEGRMHGCSTSVVAVQVASINFASPDGAATIGLFMTPTPKPGRV